MDVTINSNPVIDVNDFTLFWPASHVFGKDC